MKEHHKNKANYNYFCFFFDLVEYEDAVEARLDWLDERLPRFGVDLAAVSKPSPNGLLVEARVAIRLSLLRIMLRAARSPGACRFARLRSWSTRGKPSLSSLYATFRVMFIFSLSSLFSSSLSSSSSSFCSSSTTLSTSSSTSSSSTSLPFSSSF